jgi:ABC-type multidrug transport system fused ATPase/permease subunit
LVGRNLNHAGLSCLPDNIPYRDVIRKQHEHRVASLVKGRSWLESYPETIQSLVGRNSNAMQQLKTRRRGFGWRLVGAALAPFVVATAYLFVTRWPSYRFTTFSDYAALAVSVLAGTVFVAVLPIRPRQRVLSLFFYVPLLAVVLFFYTFWFIAVVFHDGL